MLEFPRDLDRSSQLTVDVECPLNLVPASFGVLIALEGKDMIGYGKSEEAFS